MAKQPKKQIFGKVEAYQLQGRLYKSKGAFLDAACVALYSNLVTRSGYRHMDEERISWYNTRRCRSMEDRRFEILARFRRRIERII